MTDSELYDPSTALDAYYGDRTERALGRLWVTDKTIKDWGEIGIVSYFQGAGTNPTTLSGYASNKLWLRVSDGVTDEPAEVRAFSGGDATSLSSWPLLTPSAFGAHIALDASAYNEDIGVYRPEDYGAVGNGVANDTAAFVEILEEIGDHECIELAPGAVYLVDADALRLPHKVFDHAPTSMICRGGTATLKARTAGYAVVAPARWHDNESGPCSPWSFQNIKFDCDSKAYYGLVVYGYEWMTTHCEFTNARLAGKLQTRATKNNTTIHSTTLSGSKHIANKYHAVIGWAEALPTNTGNGTIGTVTKTAGIYPGLYTVRMTSATAFTVTDPLGGTVGTGTTGSAFNGAVDYGTIAFTITAGATPFVVGDGFNIGVTAQFVNWGGTSYGTADGTITHTESNGNYSVGSTDLYCDYVFYMAAGAGWTIADNNLWGGKLACLFMRQVYREGCVEGNNFEEAVYYGDCTSTASIVVGHNKFRQKFVFLGNLNNSQRETLVLNGAHFQNFGLTSAPATVESYSESLFKRLILNNPVFDGAYSGRIIRNHANSLIIIQGRPVFEGEGAAEARIPTNEVERFSWMPTTTGAPTGTPVDYNYFAPYFFDVTNNRLYIHNGSAWKYVTLT